MKPVREHATNNAQTYFITSETSGRRALFHVESWARLFFKTLLSHRQEAYLLHDFVLMPDHFHLLITPLTSLERVVQLIKGGFSFRVKKELGSNAEVWQRGFSDHRIRDAEDFERHVHYIRLNPVKKHLCGASEEYRYSSAYPGWKLDPIPQGLKPGASLGSLNGTAEAVPLQDRSERLTLDPFPQGLKPGASLGSLNGTAEAVPLQDRSERLTLDPVPQGLKPGNFAEPADGTAKSVPFQNLAQNILCLEENLVSRK